MNNYYISFGGMLFGYYLWLQSKDELIARTWMNKKSKIGCWCSIYPEPPANCKPLRDVPEILFYEDASHV